MMMSFRIEKAYAAKIARSIEILILRIKMYG